MKIIEIKDFDGKVIFTYDEDDERWPWGNFDFSGVNLENANLEGMVWQYINLCGANLKNADFYWAMLNGSDLSGANCEEAKFWGTGLEEVNFTKANLRNAVFGKSNLGGSTDVSGANFAEAILDGAKFDATIYDAKTIFPKNFNPESNGLVRIKSK
jgi:uncharacterized protein YjbI with pentapeptide repeats